LKKVVVVVKNRIPTISGTIEENERKLFEDAEVVNNERGELVLQKIEAVNANNISLGRYVETIAVFKEWVYWEKLE
jgi:hypothetical protein